MRAATGRYSEAISLLKTVHGDLEVRAKLDQASILMYQRDFGNAQVKLEELGNQLEDSLHKYLRVDRSGLAQDVFASKLDMASDSDWDKIYNQMWDLAEVYGNLGRCFQILRKSKRSEANFLCAIEVLEQLSAVSGTYHDVALELGVRLEDSAQYDTAMEFYDDCIRDATDLYRENPDNVLALTNIGWAIAGKTRLSSQENQRISLRIRKP